VQFTRLKPEVLDAIVDLVGRVPDEFFVHASEMLRLAERLGVPGSLCHTLHHDARGRVGKVKHAPSWETMGRRSA
jgi:hypothetical protein